MPNGLPTTSSRTRETMMLGEVPTKVMMPPSREANAIGINRAEGDDPVRRANCSATGMKMASAPMFLVNTDISATAPARMGTWVRSVLR